MGRVSESDIKAAVKSEDFAPLYLFIGSESFLSAHYSAKIAEKSVDGDEAVFNLFRFDPYNFTAEDFLSAALQYPMMSDRKCITVSDMNIDALTESEWKKLIACLCDPPKWCVIIFYYTGISFTKSKNARWKEFYAVCEKQGQVCEFLRLTENALQSQLKASAAKRGSRINGVAVSLLLNHTGNDLTALLNELDKLCAYCGKTEITEDDVRLLATRNIDVSAFDLVKAINAGRKNESIRLLHELFESRCEPVLILGALASAFVDMYRVAAAEKSGIGYMEIAKYYDYKGKDFRLKNAYRISRGMTLEQARRAILILSECDRRLKYTSIDKNTALEAAVAELMIR